MLAIVAKTHGSAKKVQRKLLASCAMATSMLSVGVAQAGTEVPPLTGANTSFQGTATVAVGTANIVQTATMDTITVSTANTVIDFTPFDTANGGGPITFLPAGRTGLFVNDPNSGVTNFTVLNRIVPTDATRAIRFDGTVQSRIADAMGGTTPGGTILFYSPGGILASATSVFDVGSLVLTTAPVTMGMNGTLSFTGAAAGTAVDINAGASIMAQGIGSYVALVAPRVIQAGTVKSDGSVGYIAAESVDVTIQNNLFDINFVQGTDGGTAVAHTGTTELTRAAGDTTPQRIYVAAVPKNTAITSLVSGTLGYTAATDAMVQDGAIILSAGRNIVDSGAAGVTFNDLANPPAAASITIGADTSTVFNSSLLTNATGDAIIAPATGLTVTFNDDVTLNADRLAEVRAVAGSSAIFGGNLSVISSNLITGAAARVIALGDAGPTPAAGVISIAGDLLVNGGKGTSATAELTSDRGHVSVTGSTSLLARTDNSLGLSGNGNATGGTASVTIGAAGSQLTLSSLTVDASAKAGIGVGANENPLPGNATGGTSSLSIGGGAFVAAGVSLDSSASAKPGGAATGGTVTLNATGGTSNTGTITITTAGTQANALPERTGPVSPTAPSPLNGMMPATVTGGTVQLNVVNTTMDINGDLVLDASVTSNTGAGNLLGGTIGINVDNGSLMVGDAIVASASAEEAASTPMAPGLVRGGSITSSSINNGTILSSASSYDANATSGGDTQGGSVTLQTMTGGSIDSIGLNSLSATAITRNLESGGDATGGSLLVNITSGELVSGPLVLNALAVGGDAVMGGVGGSALGGTATVNISGGDSTIDSISVTTNAFGGKGGPAAGPAMAGGNGGLATGGMAEVNLSGGTLRTAGFAATSTARGGDGGAGDTGGNGAAATGGRAAIITAENATLFITKLPSDPNPTPFDSVADSSAIGGTGGMGLMGAGGSGGLATGGTTLLTLADADYLPAATPFAVSVETLSNATGGNGGASIGGNGGNGGNGTGGSATLTLTNNLIMFGDVLTNASASGGHGGNAQVGYGGPFMGGAGGNGSGGATTINIAAPAASMVPTSIASLTATSSATGGNGGAGDVAGVGGTAVNTGSALITQSTGATSIGSLSASAGAVTTGPMSSGGTVTVSVGPAATLTTTSLSASANASAGLGSAQGGIVNILANDGSLASTTSLVSANGTSLVSGTEIGGRGGTVDVRATTSMAGPTASLSLGTTSIIANGLSTPSGGMGAPANALAGRINLSSIGSQATSVLFSSLTASATGQTSGMMAPAGGIFLTADQGSLSVTGAATITSDESVDVSATGTGNLFVGNDLVVNARNLISVAHANRAMGARTILAAAATFTSGGNFTAMAGTSLRADTDLLISSTLGSVTANDLSAGDDLTINAGYGVTLNGLAQTSGMPMMGETSDISIVAPGAVSVNMIDAAGNFSVSADSFTANGLITAGEDISLSTVGAITTQTISAGDDVMATSAGGDISVASAIARGNGPDTDLHGADIRLQATNGAISLNSAMSHDDIFLTSLGNITASNLTASGTGGLGNRNGIIVDSASAVMLTNISSQHTIAVRGASVTASQFTAGEDIAIMSSGALSLTTATAGDDVMATSVTGSATLSGITTNGTGPDDRTVDFGPGGIGIVATAADGSNINASAGYGTLTLGTLSAANDLMASAGAITSLANTTLAAGRDLSLTAQSAISVISASAGRDLSATASAGTVDAQSLTSGDDINVSATGSVSVTSATTTGLANSGYGADTSDISINGGSASLGTISAADNLTVTATDGVMATSLLAAKGAINVNGGVSAILGTVTATLGSVTIGADAIDVTSLSAGGDANVNFIGTATVDTAVVGGNLTATGLGNFDFTSLTSTGATTINAGGSVTGATASAGGLLSLTAASVDVDSLTSTGAGSDVTVNAGIIDVTTTSAGRDAVFTTSSAPTSMITLGSASAGRDIMINGGTSGVMATTLSAGDDITLLSPGTANIMTATTTGANMGYGGDTSDINLTANTLMLGMIQAQNNLSLTATTSLSANRLTTVIGNINASAGTTATIMQTMANGGSATISADTVTLTNTTATNDVTVTHGASASLGTVTAGNAITSTGTGNASFTSLTSTGATTINAGGSVTGATASAGGLLSLTAASVDVDSLTSTGAGSDVTVNAGIIDVTTTSAGRDAVFTTSSAPTSMITLGSASAGRDIMINGGTSGVMATTLSAGDDITLLSPGTANIMTATTTGANMGYGGDTSDINLTANTLMLGMIQAQNNLSLTATTSLSANRLTTVIGNINASAGTTATIMQTMANGGSATISADTVTLTNTTATNDVTVTHGASASLGTVTAGNAITSTGTGNASFTSLTSTGATTINAGGSVTGATASAGGLLSLTAASVDVDSLTSTGAGSDVTVNAGIIDVMTTSAGRDAVFTTSSAPTSMVTLGSASAGRDIMISGGSAGVTATTLSAGDDITLLSPGTANIMTATTTGANMGYGGDTSDINLTANTLMLGMIQAQNNLSLTATTSLSANRLTTVIGNINASAGTTATIMQTMANGGSATISADTVTLTNTTATNDVTVTHGASASLGTVTAGNAITSTGTGNASFTSLTSTGATTINAGGSVTGATASAGGLLSLTAASVDVDSLTSTGAGSDVTVNAGIIDVMTTSAGRDAVFTTSSAPTSMVTLGSASAGRDIMISGGSAGVTATTLSAGDDITLLSPGTANIMTATTTGANMGYGGDTSDINLTANTLMLGMIQAQNNLSLTATTSLSANRLTTVMGNINATAGTTATIMQTMANGGSATISADTVTLTNTTATNDVTVTHGASASLGTVTAGNAITSTGTGNASFTSLTSTGATTINAGGSITGGTASAGGLLSLNAASVTATNLTSRNDSVMVTAGTSTVTTGSAALDLVISTGMAPSGSITLATGSAGRDVQLSSSGSVAVTDATAGDDIVINAGGAINSTGTLRTTGLNADADRSNILIDSGAGVTLGTVNAKATIAIRGASLMADMLTAGEDVAIQTTGSASVTNASAGDDFMITSSTGPITLGTITTSGAGLDDRTVDFGYGVIGFTTTAANGSRIDGTATTGNITLTSLISAGGTSLSAGGSITGGMASAGSLLSLTAASVDVDSLTSTGAGSDVTVNAGIIDVMTTSAGRDAVFTASSTPTSMVTLGTVTANRDVMISGGTNGVTATTLSAGDDISLVTPGTVNISSATTTGLNTDADRSNVLIDSGAGVTLGTVNANATIAIRGASLMADMLTAGEDVAIQTTGSASVTNASAGDDFMITSSSGPITLGTITTSGAGLDDRTVDFGYGVIGFTTTAANGSRIDATATTGDITFTTLNSAGAMSLNAGGSVTGGVGSLASAGGLLSVNAASVTAANLTSRNDSVMVTAGTSTVTTGSAALDLVISTGMAPSGSITLATGTAGRDVQLSSSGSVAVTDATAGDDIVINAGGAINSTGTLRTTGLNADADRSNILIDSGAGVTLGTVNANATIAIRGASLMADMLTAGEDVAIQTTGSASVTNASAGDDFMITSSSGPITLGTITTSGAGLDDRTVDFGYGVIGFTTTAANGSRIDATATTGDITFTTLNSAGAMSLNAGGSVTGGVGSLASAGGLLSVNAASVTAANLTSRNDSVMVTAGTSTVTTGSAALDLVISTGMAPSGSITLTTGSAGRDVKLLSSSGSVAVTDATAGDDIVINAGGAINSTGTLRTTGLGRGASDSDIDLTAGSTINLNLVEAFTDLSVLTAPGGTTIASGRAGDDINFNVTGDVNASLLRTTGAQANGTDSDIMVTSTGIVTVNVANAFSDFESSALSFSGNNLTAGEDIEIGTQGAASVMSALSGDDTIITSASGPIALGSANANGTGPDDEEGGSDVRLTATTGMITVGSATAGDEIDFTAGGSITATTLTAAGINPDDDRSNVLIDSGAGVTLGTVNANATIAIRGASLMADMLTAGEDVAIQTTGSASVTNASAGDDFMITSSTGPITLRTITTLGTGADDRTVDFGYGGISFLTTPANGSRIDGTASTGDITLTSLNSFGATSLTAGGSVTGGTASAGGLLSVDASSVTAANLTSRNNSVMVTAGSSTVTTGSAALDLAISTGEAPNGSITLTTGTAGRDVLLTSSGSVSVTDATADDDIEINAIGAVSSTGTLRTTGLDAYGDRSDILIDSGAAVSLGTVDANATIAILADSLTANMLTAGEDVAIQTTGSASVTNASAGDDFMITSSTGPITLGTITTSGAGLDDRTVDFGYGVIGFTTTTANGSRIDGTATTGDITFTTLNSAGAMSLNAGGSVTGGVGSLASAGGLLSVNAASVTAANLTSRNDSVIVTARNSTVTTGSAALDLVITTGRRPRVSDVITSSGSITLTTGTAGRDVQLLSSGSVSATDATAGDDIEINAGSTISSTGTLRTTGLGRDVSDSNIDLTAGSTINLNLVDAFTDISLFSAPDGTTIASGLAGDDISFEVAGPVNASLLLTTGTNADADRSNILIDSAAGVTLGTVNANATIAVRGASLTANMLTAGEDVSIQTTGSASVTDASAGDDFIITSLNGPITLGTIAALGIGLDDRTVDFGYGSLAFSTTAANGGRIDGTATTGDITLALLISSGGTSLTAGGSVTGGIASAGGLLSVSAASVDADRLISTGSDVTVSADIIDVSSTLAGRDAMFATSSTPNSSIRLGMAEAVRDIMITGGTGGVTAMTLSAGDDISVVSPGVVNLTNATTTGANVGYGSDASNITIDALSAVIGTARARDNILIDTVNGTTAANLMADRGSITVNGGTLADIGNAFASLGSIEINADAISVDLASAGVDVNIDFDTNAALGTVRAGRDVGIFGIGNANANSISAMRDLTTMVGGDVTVTHGTAGRNVRNSSANFDASTLLAGADIVVLSDESADLGNATARGRIVTNAGSSISFSNLNSDLSTSLVAGTSINGGNATAGTTLSLNANGGGVAFGNLVSGGNTTVTAQAAINGSSAFAGGALTIDSSAVGVTAGSLTAGSNSNLTVTASNGGNASIGSVRAGQDVSVNATNISVTSGMATRDIIYAAARMINAGGAAAGRDVRFTAGSDLIVNFANANGMISANSVGNTQLNNATADRIFVVASGNTFIGTAAAGSFIGINTNNVTATTLNAGEDIRLIASGIANVNAATAGDDVDISAALGGTLGNIRATATARDDRNLQFNAPSFTTVNSAGDGSEVRITSSRAVTASTLDAGDDIRINTRNFTLTGTATTRGLGNIESGSDVVINAADATVATINAASNIFNTSTSFAANTLRANGTINVFTSENASLGDANAVQGPIIASSTRGTISYATLATGGDIFLSTGGSINGGVAQAGGFVALSAANSVDFGSIISGLETSIVGGSVAGGSINAANSVSVDGDFVDIEEIESLFGSIFLSGRDINVDTAGARFDFVVRGIERTPNERITLGDIVAGRDILLSGARDQLMANSLRAGDDIEIDILGNAKIGLAITDGSFGGGDGYGDVGYGDAASPMVKVAVDVGYGSDTSNILVTAAQAMIGTAQADNNVTIETSNGTIAGTILADNGNILVNGGTLAQIDTASAPFGSIEINAARIDAGNVNAAVDVTASYENTAAFDSVTAGDEIRITGGNNLDFGSLVSGTTTTISSQGIVDGNSVDAGQAISITANGIDAGTLTSRGSSISATASTVTIGTASAAVDVTVSAGKATTSAFSLGTIAAGRDILVTGSNGNINANMLTAGDDIMVAGNGRVTIGNALTTAADNSGYGNVGYGNGTSDILIDSIEAMIGTARAKDNLTLITDRSSRSESLTADRGNILVNSGTTASIGTATAAIGSVTIDGASVDAGTVNAATFADIEFDTSALLGSVNAGSTITITGMGNARFTTLNSVGATTINAGGSVIGGSSSAGGLLSITSASVDADSLTSTGSDVTVSADIIDVSATSAGRDAVITTSSAPTSLITLGTVSANRDVMIGGGTSGVTATTLTAGDDISLMTPGSANIGNATTTGANVDSGTDTSNINLAANQLILGNIQALNNIGLSSATSLTAAQLATTLGNISVSAATSANVAQAKAVGGSATISADVVILPDVTASANVAVTSGASATLGAVMAGDAISVTGVGNLEYSRLTSGAATNLMNGGDIAGGEATAGTSFTANSGRNFTASGATNAATAVAIDAQSISTANISAGTVANVTASRSITSGNISAGTGVTLRAGTNVATGSLTSRANNVSVTAQTGMTIGSASAAVGDVLLTNMGGSVSTGALSAGNDITVSNGGSINIASATAADDVRVNGSAAVTIGSATTVGGADRDNDGNDIVIAATGPVMVTTATTQSTALATSDINLSSTMGSVNVGAGTALGNVTVSAATSLTAGTAVSGANIALTGQSINATALTAARNVTSASTGATTIGDARATGGNLTLTAGGALSATNAGALGDVRLTTSNGGNVTTGTLSSGSAFVGGTTGGLPGPGDIVIASDGNIAMTGNASAGRNVALTAKSSISVAGATTGVGIDLNSTDIIINSQTGRIGEQGRTTQLRLTNSGSGMVTIGGAGVTGSYSLANSEAQRLFAGDIIITTGAGGVILDSLSLTGANGRTGATAGNIGANGRLRIETPGKLKTIGAVAISNLTTANRFQIDAAQNIEVDAATGSISLTGAGGTPGGTLEMTAPLIVAASAAATTEVAALTEGRAINDRLAINDGAISDAGNFTADTIIVNVSNAFFVQNSGIKELSAFSFGDRRGITVGAGGLQINAASPTTRIFVSGRQLQSNGSFLTGVDFVRRQTINGTVVQLSIFPPTPFDPASTVNGCAIINSATCLINVDGGSLARDVVGQSDEDSSSSGGSGSSSDANFVQFQFKNLDEANFQPVIDDPVTGVGNDDLWALYDAKACADDQSLEGCSPK